MERPGRADLLLRVTYPVVLLGGLAWPAHTALRESRWDWDRLTVVGAALLLIVSGAMTCQTATAAHHRLAWSTYWAWSFTFVAMATSYQLSVNALPWGGKFSSATIATAMAIVLTGHAAGIFGFVMGGRARGLRVPSRGPTDLSLALCRRTRRQLTAILAIHVGIAATFATLMGPAIVSGRAAFSHRLTSLTEVVPGFGSAYFLSVGGAIVLPATAIALRRRGLRVPIGLVAASVATSAVVTNPLIGSRFLTGSFLVAVTGAFANEYWRRWIPLGLVVGFVTVFPSLDILRGNTSGSAGIAVTAPADALVNFDYDAFEMLVREVSTGGQFSSQLPTTVDLLVAPFLRWIPILSDTVAGDASGSAVATATGMGFTNVSMPLWGEAHLVGGWLGVVVAFAALGYFLYRVADNDRGIFGLVSDAPVAALMVIVLRGSLYEVLGYLILAASIGWWLDRIYRSEAVEFADEQTARIRQAGRTPRQPHSRADS